MTRDSEPDAGRERERWSRSGVAWDRWADPLAEMAGKLNEPLLDAAAIVPGARVLDLASGAGEPALSAARRAGSEGFVLGFDLVPEMLAGARRRAGNQPSLAFGVSDMTRLPLADTSVDAVTCRFGIMFVPDAAAAVTEVRRVLRPGGRAAFMVWGPRPGNPLFGEVEAAVNSVLGPDPRDDLAPLFRFAEQGRLASILATADFRDVVEVDLTPVRHAPVDQPFWRPQLEMSFAPRLAGLAPDIRAQVDVAVRARFAARAMDGVCRLPLHARIVAGTA